MPTVLQAQALSAAAATTNGLTASTSSTQTKPSGSVAGISSIKIQRRPAATSVAKRDPPRASQSISSSVAPSGDGDSAGTDEPRNRKRSRGQNQPSSEFAEDRASKVADQKGEADVSVIDEYVARFESVESDDKPHKTSNKKARVFSRDSSTSDDDAMLIATGDIPPVDDAADAIAPAQHDPDVTLPAQANGFMEDEKSRSRVEAVAAAAAATMPVESDAISIVEPGSPDADAGVCHAAGAFFTVLELP